MHSVFYHHFTEYFYGYICQLSLLLTITGCSKEHSFDVPAKADIPVCIVGTTISSMQVSGLQTKSRVLPDVVKTSFGTGDKLTLSYTITGTPKTATATYDETAGWNIVDASNNAFKLPADFTENVTAKTSANSASSNIGYLQNKLQATCTPTYTNSKFSLSFAFEQATAGLQTNVLILEGTPLAVELGYTLDNGGVQYVAIGTTAEFTDNRFFDSDGTFKVVGFRVKMQDNSYKEKTFTSTEVVTLAKGTFCFLDIYIASLNDLN